MYFIEETKKSFEKVFEDLQKEVTELGFGILHVHNLSKTLRSKGIPFSDECRVLEVCNPDKAAKVLAADMRLNMVLPCRISVYTEKGITKVGMINPAQMLIGLSDEEALADLAMEVEAKLKQMIINAVK